MLVRHPLSVLSISSTNTGPKRPKKPGDFINKQAIAGNASGKFLLTDNNQLAVIPIYQRKKNVINNFTFSKSSKEGHMLINASGPKPGIRRVISLLAYMVIILLLSGTLIAGDAEKAESPIATFSIVAGDPDKGELGIAVASRFFAVGNVVPWAKAGVGAVATQSYANTSFGWRGLELLESGLSPEEVRDALVRGDDNPAQRQFGIVDAKGNSVTYSGKGCISWAGGRSGENYAVQGNILTGEDVVVAMEKAFLETEGTLADRLYAALIAGEAKGGDSRGKQSSAMLVVKEGAGYGGYTDRAIDIRVDDHAEPFKELGRLLNIAQMNYAWNEAWTLFTLKKYADALPPMERAAKLVPDIGEVFYDLAVIRLAAGDKPGALEAVKEAIRLNPKLANQAGKDEDLTTLRDVDEFRLLIKK
jgi:uncharacterized Ntn-hydrolase superfamily protein